MKRALVVADVQNDFCPGGSLGVEGGHEIAGPLGRLAHAFRRAGLPVFYTRDWHPPRTRHFASGGGRWPDHCVQGSLGAEFHPDLVVPPGTHVVSKGSDPEEDGYSAFLGRDEGDRPLAAALREEGVAELVIGGIATDYCVRQSGLDALREGFRLVVLVDGVRSVDPLDGGRTLVELERAGARLATMEEVSRALGTEEEAHP